MTTLLRHGTIVAKRETQRAGGLIDGELITQVGVGLATGSDGVDESNGASLAVDFTYAQ